MIKRLKNSVPCATDHPAPPPCASLRPVEDERERREGRERKREREGEKREEREGRKRE